MRDEHSNVQIESEKLIGKNTKCHWDVYKNTKEQGIEQKHGDIGILVQLHFDDDKVLEGVAFLEAKRIYRNTKDDSKSKFAALDSEQLERYCSKSHFHRTVFYDVTENKDGLEAFSLTIPTQHLLTINKNNREVYPYCEYFSYCLTNRYFQGYELDFTKSSIDDVKGFLDENGGVDYLIVAQVTLKPELELKPEMIEINRKIYSRLESPKPDNTPRMTFGRR
ncbi:hypothetical protein H5089_01150 [Pseudoalteromonas sp. SR45-1]|uniref:hypothetical protein n=1 Tax=Pseudoalteromonas sp. SR45-1 TaxID=2760932 RepID=UPI0015FF51AB|nr:hypothetical protein [Pseudoalteromonas sp. SR45-1]MBB1324132.1 hypothetical protein [Pseudoalteromonas sp. SR45-1]